MYDNDSKGISYTGAFFMLIAFAVAGLIVASLLSVPVWQQLTGQPFSAIKTGMLDPANSNVMKLIQAMNAVLGFLVPTLITAALIHRRPFRLLGFTGKVTITQAGVAILMIGAALLVASSISYLTELIPLTPSLQFRFRQMEDEYSQQVAAIVSMKNPLDFVIALIVMAFLPAVCEEALFRGGLQNFLTRGTGKPWMSIIAVSILFSLAHVSFYGFFSRLLLGIVLGALYYYSGRLWISILAHFLNNAAALAALYFYTRQGKPMEEAFHSEPASLFGFIALPALVALFFYFKRISQRNQGAPLSRTY